MDEKSLINAAQNGDADAFCTLYSAYKNRLYSYAFFKLQNREDAEDAVQNCVLSAFEQIGQLKNAEAFSAWIFRILYCAYAAATKEQMRRRTEESIESAANLIAQNDMQFVLRQELLSALSQLNEQDRNIVLLSAVGGLKSHEIAQITGLSAGNVRQRLSRSLAKMKKILG